MPLYSCSESIYVYRVSFTEATDDQRLACDKLAAAAFGEPLSEADFLEREEFMRRQALAQDDGV